MYHNNHTNRSHHYNNHWYRHNSSQYLYNCFHQRQLPAAVLVLGIVVELMILFAAVYITTSAMNEPNNPEGNLESSTNTTQESANNSNSSSTGNSTSGNSASEKTSITEQETQKVTSELENEFAEQCCDIYETNKDLLVLVNKDNVIPDDYYITLRMTNGGKVKVAAILYNDLVEMLSDASDAGGYSYALLSGYRTSEYQQQLVDTDVQKYMSDYGMSYEEALEKTYEQVMPAGYSEHETGLALDITAAENTTLDESQADEPAIQWLDENCWKYGFILRYPQDKEDVTGITYEPWHFRYVGREAAKFMHENNLTLEEFYEYL